MFFFVSCAAMAVDSTVKVNYNLKIINNNLFLQLCSLAAKIVVKCTYF